MRQDDFFLNQIDTLGKVLARIISKILKLKEGGETAQFETVSQTLSEKAGLDLDELLAQAKEEVLSFLHEKTKIKDNNFEKLAELLFILGKELDNTETQKTISLFEKALVIFEHVNNTSNLFSVERISKIETLKNALNLNPPIN